MNIPEDWPTEKMIIAGNRAYWWEHDGNTSNVESYDQKMRRAFLAMLAAAPTPPAPNMRDWIQKLIAAVHLADKAIETRGEGSSKDWVLDHFLPALTEHGLGICLLQNAPTPPEQDEPVAYAARNYMSGKWGYIWHEKDDVQGWITLQHQSRDDVTFTGPIALYPHPSNDKLREAAEEVLNTVHERNLYSAPLPRRFWDAFDHLRAALEGE